MHEKLPTEKKRTFMRQYKVGKKHTLFVDDTWNNHRIRNRCQNILRIMNWAIMTEIDFRTNKTEILVRSWSKTIQSPILLDNGTCRKIDKHKYLASKVMNNGSIQGRVLETEKKVTSHNIKLEKMYWKMILEGFYAWNSKVN